jgi:hypothetical protein
MSRNIAQSVSSATKEQNRTEQRFYIRGRYTVLRNDLFEMCSKTAKRECVAIGMWEDRRAWRHGMETKWRDKCCIDLDKLTN